MPYLHIKIGKNPTEAELTALRVACENNISILPTKTRDNCMIHLEPGCQMFMRGKPEECVFVELRLYKASPADKEQEFTVALSKAIQETIHVEKQNIYMNILELEHWIGGDGTIK